MNQEIRKTGKRGGAEPASTRDSRSRRAGEHETLVRFQIIRLIEARIPEGIEAAKGPTMRPPSHGFSYIETLISMTIVLVGYAVVLGPGSYLAQSRSKTECARNLQQLHLALGFFAAEHDGALPAVAGAFTSDQPLSLLVPMYTTDTSLFICPGSEDAALPGAEPFAGKRISYAYYMGVTQDAEPLTPLASDRQLNTDPKTAGAPLFSASGKTPGNNHRKYGGSVVFLDGHIETGEGVATRDLPVPRGAVLLNPKP